MFSRMSALAFDDKDGLHKVESCDGVTSNTGRVTVTVVPWSTTLVSVSVPPCSWTQRCTTTSPSPVPGRVPTLLARVNEVNRRSCSSAGMPMLGGGP